jgi:hypothetical protein
VTSSLPSSASRFRFNSDGPLLTNCSTSRLCICRLAEVKSVPTLAFSELGFPVFPTISMVTVGPLSTATRVLFSSANHLQVPGMTNSQSSHVSHPMREAKDAQSCSPCAAGREQWHLDSCNHATTTHRAEHAGSIRVLLNREGWNVSRYLAYRLYQEEGLALRPRRSRRRRAAVHAGSGFVPRLRIRFGVWIS